MIVEKVIEAKQSKIRQYPCHTNRASELGHPCLRYLVFNRTRWSEKVLHDVGLQFVFDLGNSIEDLVIRDLKDAGFQVIEQQRSFEWPRYQISGHIDGKILIDGVAYPLEIKSVSPFIYESINSVSDMHKSKYLHVRKYPSQITLYLLMDSKERGVMLLKNKSTGRLKEIWFDLDYELGESLLQKAEAVNRHIAEGTIPEPIEWDDSICPECPFLHICTPERIGKEIEVINDDGLLELLQRWDSLKPMAREFEEVDRILKEKLQGRNKILIGDFFIDGKWRKLTTYDIPEDVKKRYAKETRYWVRKIIKVSGPS